MLEHKQQNCKYFLLNKQFKCCNKEFLSFSFSFEYYNYFSIFKISILIIFNNIYIQYII